eukprot:scaffold779_cov165-Amphora_coffeaeformis.AAC.5
MNYVYFDGRINQCLVSPLRNHETKIHALYKTRQQERVLQKIKPCSLPKSLPLLLSALTRRNLQSPLIFEVGTWAKRLAIRQIWALNRHDLHRLCFCFRALNTQGNATTKRRGK